MNRTPNLLFSTTSETKGEVGAEKHALAPVIHY